MVNPDSAASSWVACDSCGKWRRLPKALVELLEDDAPWYCEQNPQASLANCDAPQELTNEQIDQEMESSEDEGGSEDERERREKRRRRPAVWQLITKNIYTHRERKMQDEDDIMICQCRRTRDGSPGCGPDCLNRMLNIECVEDYCPCEEQCSNQMFSKRQYADLEKRRAGSKGFGLFTKQDLQAGAFIIEYIGEVLEEEEYMRRKEYYIAAGQRHYYFMNVGNGEVIDACRKGALGRFINHSCDPNCETQKWVVHGELAIGLFAQRDIKAGEELTFDYNFERYGDKPMRCLCGSASCRGFIGGTQEINADRDFDEPEDASMDPEPIMVTEGEEDELLAAILDSNVGLADQEFDADVRKKLHQLAVKHKVPIDWESSDDDENDESKSSMDQIELTTAGKGDGDVVVSKPRQPPSRDVVSIPSSAWPPLKFKRRSEVDRRLDTLATSQGRLREPNTNNIVRMLRLFNLCDIASTGAPALESPVPGSRYLLKLPPRKEQAKADEPAEPSDAALAEARKENGHHASTSEPAKESSPEAGEILPNGNASPAPAPRPGPCKPAHREGGLRQQDSDGRERERSRSKSRERERPGSTSHREDGELPAVREAVRFEPPREGLRYEERLGSSRELTARQRARMADLSLLLDVILKTNSSSAKKEFCRCGTLRQLQSTIGRCTGPYYSVILKKMLRVVECLPFTADDLHQTSSAHGSFADVLKQLSMHADAEVRNRSKDLLKKFPMSECSEGVQRSATAHDTVGLPPSSGRGGNPSSSSAFWGERGDRERVGRSVSRLMRPTRFSPAVDPITASPAPSTWATPPSTFSKKIMRPAYAPSPQYPMPSLQPAYSQDDPGIDYSPDKRWDAPNARFEAFVDYTVRHRLGKYTQPVHPNYITADDFSRLYKKIKHNVVEAEQKTFEDRRRNNMGEKPIERDKMEERIKTYVRETVKAHNLKKRMGLA
ncbi:hypothetical protein WJX72_004317 [[Myrmecia] bisecta]|uniref:Uncharacterized protein n=1 Tax=[Myrmecia] bisecta TaxID=41462 RepID=A0AAW1Q6J1_9CHLO